MNFFSLDIGLPVEQLKRPIRAVMSDGGEPKSIQVDAVNRRGKAMRCQVSLVPMKDTNQKTSGLIIMVDDLDAVSSQVDETGG